VVVIKSRSESGEHNSLRTKPISSERSPTISIFMINTKSAVPSNRPIGIDFRSLLSGMGKGSIERTMPMTLAGVKTPKIVSSMSNTNPSALAFNSNSKTDAV